MSIVNADNADNIKNYKIRFTERDSDWVEMTSEEMGSDAEHSETPVTTPPPKKKKYIPKKFQTSWLQIPEFQGWLAATSDITKAFCRICSTRLTAGKSEIDKHRKGSKHIAKAKLYLNHSEGSNIPLKDPLKSETPFKLEEGTKLATIYTKRNVHNIALNVVEHMTPLMKADENIDIEEIEPEINSESMDSLCEPVEKKKVYTKRASDTGRRTEDPLRNMDSYSSHQPQPQAILRRMMTMRDEFDNFGENISIRIRKLATDRAKSAVQYLIGQVIYEAESGKYDNGIPPYTISLGTPSNTPSGTWNNTSANYSEEPNSKQN